MGIIYEFFSRKIFWGTFKLISYLLFFLIVAFYPFHSEFATILLFFYIALWSRIPCMVSDFTKDFDMIDFFSVIIAVNINSVFSGLYAAIFSSATMMISRLFGPDEELAITLIEIVGFFFASFFTPIVYKLTGNNLLLTMYIFTIQRYGYELIFIAKYFKNLMGLAIMSMIIGAPIAYIMNRFMIIFLAPFFSSVFETGLRFNFPLFFFGALLTISAHYIEKYMSNEQIVEDYSPSVY